MAAPSSGTERSYRYPPTPDAERGGTFAGANQTAKNYMQYNQAESYDDDNYSSYASSNYGSDGGGAIHKNDGTQSQMGSQLYPPPSNGQKRGFEVMNQDALVPSPNTQQPILPVDTSSSYYTCPVCATLATKTCSCQYRDAMCSNGHSWFLEQGRKQPGVSIHHK
jgi:hypothetical protein